MKTAKYRTYLKQIELGNITSKKILILKTIREQPGLIERSISQGLRIPLQTVSARVSELKDLGLVYSNGQDEKYDSVHEFLFVEEDPVKIEANQKERKKTKYKNWLRQFDQFKDLASENLISSVETEKIYGKSKYVSS